MANTENDPEILALAKNIIDADQKTPGTREIIRRIVNSNLLGGTNNLKDIKQILDAVERISKHPT